MKQCMNQEIESQGAETDLPQMIQVKFRNLSNSIDRVNSQCSSRCFFPGNSLKMYNSACLSREVKNKHWQQCPRSPSCHKNSLKQGQSRAKHPQ